MQTSLKEFCFIVPLIFIFVPFFVVATTTVLIANLAILGLISITAFVLSASILAIVSNLNIGGSGSVIATGISGRIGLNSEGGYQLFVLVFGGIFYGVTTVISFFYTTIYAIVNFVMGLFGQSLPTITSAEATSFNSAFWNLSLTVFGIPIFLMLQIVMGLIYLLGLFLMISTRGH
jgi:hypothetical protein